MNTFDEIKNEFLGENYQTKVKIGKYAVGNFMEAFEIFAKDSSLDLKGFSVDKFALLTVINVISQFVYADGNLDENELEYLNDIFSLTGSDKLAESDVQGIKNSGPTFDKLDYLIDQMGRSNNSKVTVGKFAMFVIAINFCSIDGDITLKEKAMLIQLLDA